jgi:predicted metal-dependent phosphoesterase TrpH
VATAVSVAGTRLRVVPGVELSSTHAGTDLHVLGYGIDVTNPALHAYTERARTRRAERIQGMVLLLADLGVAVEFEEVLASAGDRHTNLGRPHLAQALVRRGHVNTVSEAFDRYLHDGGPAAIPIELITPREAIELIRAAGGVAVWAHPPAALLARELPHFVEWGLEGIECYRPRTMQDERNAILQQAARFDLLLTGGSDWHGIWHGPLGDFAISTAEIQKLLWRLDGKPAA